MNKQLKELQKRNTKHYCEGKTLRQLSEESGVPIGTINGRWQRGIRDYAGLTSWDGLKGKKYRMDCATEQGRRLLAAIYKNDTTITDFSKRANVSRNTVIGFINGKDTKVYTVARMCAAAHVSIDYVMGVSG